MFKLHTFGGLSLTQDGRPCERSAIQRRQLAVLAALAAAGTSGVSRDKLIGLMWPDRENNRARSLLDQALYAARRVCGQSVFTTSSTALAINPEVLSSDVAEFTSALDRRDWAAAAAAYSGPFLDGLLLADAAEFERWMSVERSRFAREYQRCVEALAIAEEGRGQLHEAVRWWRRAVEAEPLRGRAARGLIEALARDGDRAGALEFARVHEALVREEMGENVGLDPSVATLVQSLRLGEWQPPALAHGPDRAAVSHEVPPTDLLPQREQPRHAQFDASKGPPPPGSTAERPGTPSVIPGSPALVASADVAGRRASPRRVRFVKVTLSLLVVAIAAVALWSVHRGVLTASSAESTTQPPSIAVLPFRNLGPTSADEYFSDGMTEDLIAELSRLQGVRVVARTSSFAFKGRPMDVRDVGRALNVTNILEGTVRRIADRSGGDGGRLRVSAELVDTRSGYQIWSQQFDRPVGDVLMIQDEIAESIRQSLQRKFAGDMPHLQRTSPPPAVYDMYLRARYALHRRTSEGLRVAVELFQEAIESEPRYAPAYSGLGAVYAVLPLYDHRTTAADMYALADSAASQALLLDSSISEPYAVLAIIRARRYDWRSAEMAFRQALARNANDATAHQWYGKALAHQGRLAEAETEIRRALELDPLSAVTRYNLGQVLYADRRYGEAADELIRALATAPTLRAAHATLGYVRLSQGRKDDAIQEFESAAGPDSGRVGSDIAVLAYGYASAGQRDTARQLLSAALRDRAADPSLAAATSAADIAIAFMALGDVDEAFAWLERARTEYDSDLQAFMASPILDSLRPDRRYAELRRQMNLP